jgi:hypothetical protein
MRYGSTIDSISVIVILKFKETGADLIIARRLVLELNKSVPVSYISNARISGATPPCPSAWACYVDSFPTTISNVT